MRIFPAIASLCVIGLSFAGCSTIESDITSAANTIEQPQVQAALATVKTVSTALVCDVASGSALAKSVATAAGAHTGTVNEVDVISTAVCTALDGAVVAGVTEKNVPAVAVVSVPLAGKYKVIAK